MVCGDVTSNTRASSPSSTGLASNCSLRRGRYVLAPVTASCVAQIDWLHRRGKLTFLFLLARNMVPMNNGEMARGLEEERVRFLQSRLGCEPMPRRRNVRVVDGDRGSCAASTDALTISTFR